MHTIRSRWLASLGAVLLVFVPAFAEEKDSETPDSAPGIRVGVAEADITPPNDFPMAGYYHERLSLGTVDPLKAKAIVFRGDETSGVLVVCDLIGITTDLAREVRKRISEQTGIPSEHVVISATHSHTAPAYAKELYLFLGDEKQSESRASYIEKLIAGPVAAAVDAFENAQPVVLESGAAIQETPVSFNRRSVLRDGSVRTWLPRSHPEVVKAAGPIDPEIGLLAVRSAETNELRGVLSNFALHLDTLGGRSWSADYPSFIERSLRQGNPDDLISIFAAGTCGDINHNNPENSKRLSTEAIGNALAESIRGKLADLQPIANPRLAVHSKTLSLKLQDSTMEDVRRSVEIINQVKSGAKVDFYDHVTAHKKIRLDHYLHQTPFANPTEYINSGLSRSLAGIGDSIPVDVTVMTLGDDLAIVCLPGEVFVDLGLAIKQASPFRNTIIVELSNVVELIYVPHRAAYAGGSYEVTNSTTVPGSGEKLVETAVSLLRKAANEKP